MSVRRATLDDLPLVCDLAGRFHAYSPWKHVTPDPEAIATFAAHCIENGAVFITDDQDGQDGDDTGGMCGGVLTPLYFAPDFKVAVELVWWAPRGGQALRAAFEDWARSVGASAIQFSALGDEHLPAVSRIYRRAGFVLAEAAFLKEL